jgi:hypothetical protein
VFLQTPLFYYSLISTFLRKCIGGEHLNKKTDRERMVGALGAGGGSLLLNALTNYLLFPEWRDTVWLMNLSFGLVGTFLILGAVYIHLKK